MALKKDLGLLDVFCIASGAMISSGLFILPAIVYASVGPWVVWCYLLAVGMMVPAVLSKAELASALPKSGGAYFFIDRGVGPGFGMLGGVAAWASLCFKTAFALLGIGIFAKVFFPVAKEHLQAVLHLLGMGISLPDVLSDGHVKLIGLGLAFLFMLFNLAGVKHAGRLQVGLVLVLLAILVAYVAGGLSSAGLALPPPAEELPITALFAGAGMVFISFAGVTKVASVGEEVRDPGRNLARGMILSFVVVSALYVASILVTCVLLSGEGPSMADTQTPLTLAAEQMWKGAGLVLLSFAALLAFMTTANAGILAASRVPMAMSRDGLIPRLLGTLGKRGTPTASILATSCFIAAVLFMPLELFVKTASTLTIMLFMFEILSLILMRESGMENYQPRYRSPFYPWLHAAGLVCYGFLLVELGSMPLLIAGVILAGAAAWYGVFVRTHVVRESALTHLAKRIASRTLGTHDLENELAQIVRERDRVQEDDFDRLVRRSLILDLPGRVSRDELFHMAAARLGRDLGVPPSKVHRMLNERERASSTVVRPGLAIPHVVVEGKGLFDIMLVRCREGVIFEEDKPPVHAVFVLIGSPDARPQHLRALMAVAEIAQDPGFERKWLRARDEAHLRRLVLASKRRREVILP